MIFGICFGRWYTYLNSKFFRKYPKTFKMYGMQKERLKMNKKIILTIVGIIAGLGLFHVVNQYFGMKDDNPIEEAVEEIVEAELGTRIDLTP